MDILKTHTTLRSIADVCHHIQSFDGIGRDHVGNEGFGAGEWVVECLHAASFVDGESPAVGVDVGVSAAALEASGQEEEMMYME